METGLYLLLLMGSTYFFCRYLTGRRQPVTDLLLSSLPLVAASMTRPETYVFPVVNLGFILAKERSGRLRAVTVFLLPFLVIFVPYYLWRYQYFGYPFPNTYYAKVGGGSLLLSLQGLRYLLRGMLPHLVLGAFIIGRILRSRHCFTATDRYLLSMLFVWMGITIYTGADHFAELRFFVYMLPFIYLLCVREIQTFTDYLGRRASKPLGTGGEWILKTLAVYVVCVVSFLTLFYSYSMGPAATRVFGKHLAGQWALLGRWLEQNTLPGDKIATPVVGAIGYYCDRTIIDMLGIVDPTIAHTSQADPGQGPKDHDRFNTAYVLSRKPKYIYLLPFAPDERAFINGESWIPAIEDLKRYFPNEEYQYGVVAIGPFRHALYRRIGDDS